MISVVYKSEKKQGAYLYLAQDKSWEDIPDELRKTLGSCTQVMEIDLSQRDKLASEDIELVKNNLTNKGYHLQLPPTMSTGVINYGV